MYESPIKLLMTDIHNQIMAQQEDAVYQAVLHYLPDIDRAELLRALQYDRDQYAKGYADGKADAEKKLVRCGECSIGKPSAFGRGWVFCRNNRQHHQDTHFCSYGKQKDGADNG